MKTKRGFTFSEMLATIAIISIVFSVALVAISNIQKNVLKKDYDNLVKYLETKAADYASSTNITTVSVEKLILEGYVQPDDDKIIYNPIDKTSMNCYILKATLKDNKYTAELREDLGTENGVCNKYEPTENFQICKLDLNSGNCDVIKNTDWFNEQIILAVKDRNEGNIIDLETAKYNWISNNGYSSTEKNVVVDTVSVSQNTYKVEIILDSNTRGEAIQLVNIDKQAPVIISSDIKTGWAFEKVLKVEATDMSGSGIKGYSFPNSKDECMDYTLKNTHTYSEEGEYKYCIMDNAGNITERTITIDKIDNTTPVKPTITPSDGVSQENWHDSDFKLVFTSINEQSKSKIKYYYGTSKNNLNDIGSEVLIDGYFNRKTIYVKACNEAGTCSEINSYKVLYDNTPPVYESGGSLGNGTISKPEYTDNAGGSGNVNVYVCVSSGNAPTYGDSCFSAIDTKFNVTCGVTYKLYSYAVDAAGNKSEIYDHYTKNNTNYNFPCNQVPVYYPIPACDATCEMVKNSNEWWNIQNNPNISDAVRSQKQAQLHAANVELAKQNSACLGTCTYNNGDWYNANGGLLYTTSGGPKTGNK